ncbi:MAG: endonuclease MutS2 [Subdoligranulum sp.]|nr:MAG: endonuclease MutS2 [Subdoligranulum sp.]
MIEERTLKKLEYFEILNKISQYTTSTTAKNKVSNLRPESALEKSQSLLDETEEAVNFLNFGVSPDFALDSTEDIAAKAKIRSTLSLRELLVVMRTLRTSRLLISTLNTPLPVAAHILPDMANGLYANRAVEEEIDFCVLNEDELNDKASDALFSIRQKIKKTNAEIREKLTSFSRSSTISKYLQDDIVTLRNDRYVIPVKQEYKSNVQGIVHDQSSTGSTLYIEPIAIVNLNNQLRELLLKEREEIERILSEFTDKISVFAQFLVANSEIIAYLDGVFAKARYCIELNATRPKLNDRGILEIKRGRHPLIDKKSVVPIDLRLGGDFDMIVITGPNTGGKTVSLKTTGLFCLMAMSGIFLPAAHETIVSVFENIFCDIGDEQSIEQSLSTFSSHIKNISHIAQSLNRNSLVLLDEVGAGTDPAEGAALALAIAEYILDSGAKSVLTTHYGRLKEFSLTTPKVASASMEFDTSTLSPTYRLVLGIPGSSNALDIAGRLGLCQKIVDNARGKLSSEKVTFENVLRNADTLRREYKAQLDEINSLKASIQEEYAKAADQTRILKEERERLLSGSQIEAKRIVSNAKAEAEELLDKLKKMVRAAALEEKSLFEARSVIKKLDDKKYDVTAEEPDIITGARIKPEKLKIGECVFVKKMNTSGIVSGFGKNGKIEIKINKMTVFTDADDLYECVDLSDKPKPKVSQGVKTHIRAAAPAREIILLGQTVDEAIANVDKFLDDAVLSGLSEVRVVHGSGTGALRKGLHKYFATHPAIDSFRLGKYGEGESGVTIVTLK